MAGAAVVEWEDASASVFQSDLPTDSKIEQARTELLDLSARNRLLNIPRSAKIVRSLEIVHERASEVFRMLLREGKTFTFLPSSSTLRRPDMLPPAELCVAIQEVVAGSFGASPDEIGPAVARVLGFKATSAQMREAIAAQVEGLTQNGALVAQGAMLVAAPASPVSAAM